VTIAAYVCYYFELINKANLIMVRLLVVFQCPPYLPQCYICFFPLH